MTFYIGTLKKTLRMGLLTLFVCATCFVLGIATERHFAKQIAAPLLAVVQNDLSGNQQKIDDLNAERDKIVADLERRMKDVLKSESVATDQAATLRNSYRAMQRIRDMDFEASLYQKEMASRMNAYGMVEKQLMDRQ